MDLIHKFSPWPYPNADGSTKDQCVYDIGGANCGRPKDDPHHEGYVSGVMDQREADNLQRRRYAETAMGAMISTIHNEEDYERMVHLSKLNGLNRVSEWIARDAFKQADAMLIEQQRRESFPAEKGRS